MLERKEACTVPRLGTLHPEDLVSICKSMIKMVKLIKMFKLVNMIKMVMMIKMVKMFKIVNMF